MKAILQATSDLVVDSGRDTLDTAAAGETAGGEAVSFCVVQGSRRVQSQQARKQKKRTYRMAGFATQREKDRRQQSRSQFPSATPDRSLKNLLTPMMLSFKTLLPKCQLHPKDLISKKKKPHPQKGKKPRKK